MHCLVDQNDRFWQLVILKLIKNVFLVFLGQVSECFKQGCEYLKSYLLLIDYL